MRQGGAHRKVHPLAVWPKARRAREAEETGKQHQQIIHASTADAFSEKAPANPVPFVFWDLGSAMQVPLSYFCIVDARTASHLPARLTSV